MNTKPASPFSYTHDDVAGVRLLQAAAARREAEEARRANDAAKVDKADA